MKIALASLPFVNNEVAKNLQTITNAMIQAKSRQAELLCFGESFLQGFDAFNWNYENDLEIALALDSKEIKKIQEFAMRLRIAVSFGYFEKENGVIYSSYVFIGQKGEVINNFRRLSIGWKEKHVVDEYYQEGSFFQSFLYLDKTFVVGLCGDFWYEENIKKIRQIHKDIVLWPVYINYTMDTWNDFEKEEYATNAKRIGNIVLLINSLSTDPISHGGCYYYQNGEIVDELSFGAKGILYIDL